MEDNHHTKDLAGLLREHLDTIDKAEKEKAIQEYFVGIPYDDIITTLKEKYPEKFI